MNQTYIADALQATLHHIDEVRVRVLRDTAPGQGPVVYWMQRAQRAEDNHALEYAILAANELDRPLLALFCLTDGYPDANLRHYCFMLEGLAVTKSRLEQRGIPMIVFHGSPPEVVERVAATADVALLVTDKAYLRVPRLWRRDVVGSVQCPFVEVETDLVVPIELASQKREFAARTIRPKIHKLLDQFLRPVPTIDLGGNKPQSRKAAGRGPTAVAVAIVVDAAGVPTVDLDDPAGLARSLDVDTSVEPCDSFARGGADQAEARLDTFLAEKLLLYSENRNKPVTDDTTGLSAYLHFGQISPIAIALAAREAAADGAAADAVENLIEELVVRRELAFNYCYYEANYDSYRALPDWAKKTLAEHTTDVRTKVYSIKQLEAAETDDPYWNAAMKEMRVTGSMHNYMRMYWGKKILEWTRTPEEAFERTLYLNNRYFLDGRDPNSFTGVAWVFGLHDRPWTDREVFGKVRYMNAKGLERKSDIKAYVEKIDRIIGPSQLFTAETPP